MSNNVFSLILGGILLLQAIAGLWHISDPYIDGRLHYNWGPPFWLIHAKAINDVGLIKADFGVVDGRNKETLSFYSAHPPNARTSPSANADGSLNQLASTNFRLANNFRISSTNTINTATGIITIQSERARGAVFKKVFITGV